LKEKATMDEANVVMKKGGRWGRAKEGEKIQGKREIK